MQREFTRLTKDESRVGIELRAFLGRAYQLKAIADYETGPGSAVSPELATAAIETSKLFVARIIELIASDRG